LARSGEPLRLGPRSARWHPQGRANLRGFQPALWLVKRPGKSCDLRAVDPGYRETQQRQCFEKFADGSPTLRACGGWGGLRPTTDARGPHRRVAGTLCAVARGCRRPRHTSRSNRRARRHVARLRRRRVYHRCLRAADRWLARVSLAAHGLRT
jgi:hypothetical protein